IPDMLMQDASWHNQTILQWLSSCQTRWPIDGEIGDLKDDLITSGGDNKPLLCYLRYNLWIELNSLNTLMNKTYTQQQVNDLDEMSNADSRFELYDIGSKDAATKITDAHFPGTFKL
ncbi:MAG TPA: hypothetical protein VKI61_17735, partial [Chitinophagaceae bacterium]|nr:hypothetical protein [Chitinophagaceae bacterium]